MSVKQIGLDRVVLTVDEEQVKTQEGVDMYKVNIKDKAIFIRPNALNGGKVDVNITCPKIFGDTNEKNVTVEDFDYLIETIQDTLEGEGVLLDVANARLGSFEVNYNVNDSKFYDVLKLIAKANINDNLKAFYVENKDGIQSVKVKKKRYTVKVYKKSEHLQESFKPIDEEYVVRFEVSTNAPDEKEKLFGGEVTLQGLIDNWERVEEWYRNCIKLTIKKPIEKYIKQLEDDCLALLERGVKPSNVVATLMLREDLVDVVAFENAMKKHYKATGKKKPHSVIKSAHKRMLQLDENKYNQVVGNVSKLEELYDLIGLE